MSLVIRQSAIHSRGCYTTEPIKKNALIIEYVGPHLTNKEANDLYDDYEQTYLFGLENGKTIIDGIGVAAFITIIPAVQIAAPMSFMDTSGSSRIATSRREKN